MKSEAGATVPQKKLEWAFDPQQRELLNRNTTMGRLSGKSRHHFRRHHRDGRGGAEAVCGRGFNLAYHTKHVGSIVARGFGT
jgi:hypothetical protein